MRTPQRKSQTSQTAQSADSQTKRLHITPLTSALLPRLLGQFLPLAQDISFHHLKTFSNRDYGFVTLPAGAADMVRKKVHGTLLKGEKVAVEDARADTRLEKSEQERTEEEIPQRALRKRKRENGIAAAVELPDGRKVRRGWTETKRETEGRKIKEKKEKKKDVKAKAKTSAFTDQSECLFKTKIPKDVKTRSSDRKKARAGEETTVVHEFENTTKYPSYLRQETSDKKKTLEFDEEKGWVDEDGNVVEKPAETTRKRKTKGKVENEKDLPDSNETSGAKDDEDEDDETSSSGSSSSSEDEQDSGSDSEEKAASSPPVAAKEESRSSNGPSVSITEASPVTPHPLETLFKKPRPPTSDPSSKSNLEINTSFTFFNNDDGGDEAEPAEIERSLETPGLPALRRRGLPNLSIPVTPYNPRDMQWRSQRSAAPTPDTAAPGKGSFGDPFGLLADIRREREQDIEEEDEENENDDEVMQGIEQEEPTATPPIKPEPTPDGKEGDFSKWFWDSRGANNQAWKKNKRDAAKQQRTRENRRRKA